MIIADDNDDKKNANQIASELVNNKEVLRVVGHYSSGVTLAVKERYAKENLVTISQSDVPSSRLDIPSSRLDIPSSKLDIPSFEVERSGVELDVSASKLKILCS
ncbi:MAG: hypothetical protein Fur006_47070 [Coleofasciculaceae cyanobacterium]